MVLSLVTFRQNRAQMSSAPAPSTADSHPTPTWRTSFEWAFLLLGALYVVGRFLQIYPGGASLAVVVAFHVLPTAIFAVMHGAKLYGSRDMVKFLVIVLVVGNVFENLGVRAGFPFGHYYFTGLMGPKFLVVPILLGFAYIGMGYFSWILAKLILRPAYASSFGTHIVLTPVLAAFIMVAWDLSQDPAWSTILHLWIWRDGGAYFGVPVTNFLGWYLTVYVIFQAFALWARNGRFSRLLPKSYWRQPVWFYSLSAAGNLLLVLPNKGPSFVTDLARATWRVADITAACAVVTIFTMGMFALLGWISVEKL